MNEREFLLDKIIKNSDARILEIGPLNYPIVKKDQYPNAVYCDVKNTDQVKELYRKNDYLEITGIQIDIDTIVDIDYVLKETYEETFRDLPRFDVVMASHVMEHVQDIIATIRDVSTILKPSGLLILLYPDQRFCFDHFRQSASFRDAYAVYRDGTTQNARMAFDFYLTAISENDPSIFWKGRKMEDYLPQNSFIDAENAYNQFLKGIAPADIHYWPFTDESFLQFLYDMTRAGLLPFSLEVFHPTQENAQQFLVILRKDEEVYVKPEITVQKIKQFMKWTPANYYNSDIINANRLIHDAQQEIEVSIKIIENLSNINLHLGNKITEGQDIIDKRDISLVNNQNEIEQMKKSLQIANNENEKLTAMCVNFSTQQESMTNAINALQQKLECIINEAREKEKYLIAENASILNTTNQRIDVLEREVEILEKEKVELSNDLNEIIKSHAWKFTRPFRKLKDIIVKPNK